MAIIRRGGGGGELAGRREQGRDPFQQMQSLMGMDPLELFRQMTGGALAPLAAGPGAGFVPDFEVRETKDAYIFEADLPGVEEADVEVSVTGDRLTISGRRQEERREEGDRYFAYERAYGNFSRTFTLPEGVDVNNMRAELANGVLRIVLPKKPEVQPRRIPLGRGGGAKGGEPKH